MVLKLPHTLILLFMSQFEISECCGHSNSKLILPNTTEYLMKGHLMIPEVLLPVSNSQPKHLYLFHQSITVFSFYNVSKDPIKLKKKRKT